MLEQLKNISSNPDICYLRDKSGKILYEQPLPAEFEGFPELFTNRGRTLDLMYEYAVSLGAKIHFDTKVTEVFETAEFAGVHIGQNKFSADFVVAADGVHSHVRHVVTGVREKAEKSGFAVFRSWFSIPSLLDDPLTAPIAQEKKESLTVWIGEDCHAILVTDQNLKSLSLSLTHKVRDFKLKSISRTDCTYFRMSKISRKIGTCVAALMRC